jgi:thiol-disulfide isomerase/thioredoxin
MFRRRRLVFAVVFGLVAAVAVGGYFARESLEDLIASTLIYESRAEWEFVKLRDQFAKGQLEESVARERGMTIGRENRGSRVGVAAYVFVANTWPETSDAEAALIDLRRAMQRASIDDLASCFDQAHLGNGEQWRPLVGVLLTRVEQEPAHPRAAKLLTAAAGILKPMDRVDAASDELIRIADLVEERYGTSPDLVNFCEHVSNGGEPAGWTRPFEPHVRHVLEVNESRFVRSSALFALATIVRSNGIERQDEAKQLYKEFLDTFDGETSYPGQAVEQRLRQKSELALRIIETHGLGMQAPETRGIDLKGKEISLNDYRGRVVLVSFWATWCAPCIQAIPHERELLERFGNTDFAILGMNADDDIEKAIAAVEKHGITWRSLRVKESGFVNNWTIRGYPTFCLLDRDGVIVGFWTGLPPDVELIATIRGLIKVPRN